MPVLHGSKFRYAPEAGGIAGQGDCAPDLAHQHLFDELELAALDYAEAMTLSDQRVTDEQLTALRRHFDDDGIVELTALVAFQNLSSKFNTALAVPSQGFCHLPDAAA